MSSITPVKSVGCFQSVVNFHNEGTLKLSESLACVSHLEIKNDGDEADCFLVKIGKMFVLTIAAIPLFIFHVARELFNKVTDCCGKTTESIKNEHKKTEAEKGASAGPVAESINKVANETLNSDTVPSTTKISGESTSETEELSTPGIELDDAEESNEPTTKVSDESTVETEELSTPKAAVHVDENLVTDDAAKTEEPIAAVNI